MPVDGYILVLSHGARVLQRNCCSIEHAVSFRVDGRRRNALRDVLERMCLLLEKGSNGTEMKGWQLRGEAH
jgi:phage gp36-like protein